MVNEPGRYDSVRIAGSLIEPGFVTRSWLSGLMECDGVTGQWVESRLVITGVGVEKVAFGEDSRRFGDRKCSPESRKSLVGHPSAMKFMSAPGG